MSGGTVPASALPAPRPLVDHVGVFVVKEITVDKAGVTDTR